MRYTKAMETDTLARDAALVSDLQEKYVKDASARNEKSFEAAQAWFIKKHQCLWQGHVKNEERQR